MNMLKENRSYIYAHYALHDKDMVIPIIDFLISSNFNVKNSNFSNMHKEDAAYKKEILDSCTHVIIFLTNALVESQFCREIILQALDTDKEILVINFENVELAYGLELALGTSQAIFRNKFSSNEDFYRAISESKILKPCNADYFDDSKFLEVLKIEIPEQEKYVQLCYFSANRGDAGKQYELGECYYYGIGVNPDTSKAIYWYNLADCNFR